ncbi:MAG: hypothetical protein ACRDTX_05905 [Pseudonocardiaceae bacterium]
MVVRRRVRKSLAMAVTGGVLAAVVSAVSSGSASATGSEENDHSTSGLPRDAIEHVLVVDLENENFADTFGSGSPATYLNQELVPQGQLLTNYYATGHASTDNYIAQVSGQAPNKVSGSDCIVDTTTLVGRFSDVTPGTPDPDQATYPGQVDGEGCVYPGPNATSAGVQTIADQLDAQQRRGRPQQPTWRAYAEDMGNDAGRDGGDPDPLGGTDCAHPPLDGADLTNKATATDQYADRHVPFVFFHSIIDNTVRCDTHVVPLGTVKIGAGGQRDTFAGPPRAGPRARADHPHVRVHHPEPVQRRS